MTPPKQNHCEWCVQPATWRYHRGTYERFSCNEHIRWTRRLLNLDLGAVPYQFEPAAAVSR